MAARKPEQLTSLVEKINIFTSSREVEGDPYLNGLREAIASKKNLHVWAELDPLDYLPHPEARAHQSRSRLVRILTVIRNVLVFAPVALTWAAVGQATTSFSIYIDQNGADVVNFLDFWQNGYGILDDKWKIGEVARLDFLMIMVVIALTLYVSQAGHTSEKLRDEEEDTIDRERMALALEIHAQLHDKRKITTVTMNASLAGSISRLVNATHNLEDASKVLEKASRKIPKPTVSSSFLDTYSFDDNYSFGNNYDVPKKRKPRGA